MPFSPYGDGEGFERLWLHGRQTHSDLAQLLEVVVAYRQDANRDAMLLRGFRIDDDQLGRTPDHWSADMLEKRTVHSEATLLTVASMLGEVFSFRRQHDGNLVQNVVPVRADADEQTGTGSSTFLKWHTEDPFDAYRADFILLLCLRADPQAQTAIAPLRDVPLSSESRQCLQEPRFLQGIDRASGGTGRAEDGIRIPVLTGSTGEQIHVDLSCCTVASPDDHAAVKALAELQEKVDLAAQFVVMERGDVLIIDNYRAMHARTAFQPRYDGSDRWIQRVSVSTRPELVVGTSPRVIGSEGVQAMSSRS